MPAKLKSRPVRKSSIHGFSEAKRIQLLYGANYFDEPDGYDMNDPDIREVMKADWIANRDSLLASYDRVYPKPWAVEQFETRVRFKPRIETR